MMRDMERYDHPLTRLGGVRICWVTHGQESIKSYDGGVYPYICWSKFIADRGRDYLLPSIAMHSDYSTIVS